MKKSAFLLCVCLLLTAVMSISLGAFAEEEIYYGDNGYINSDTETFSYTSKTYEIKHFMYTSYPKYYNNSASISNTCANVAGAEILAYYDRTKDDLIPDCTVGYMRGTIYNYYPMGFIDTKIQSLINTLYTKMLTNTSGVGTSQSDFKQGFTNYVQGRSHSVSYTSVMSASSLNKNSVVSEMQAGHPVVLYLSNYSLCTHMDDGKTVNLYFNYYNGNHMVVAFGIATTKYYNSSNVNFRTDSYLIVSPGFYSQGYDYYYLGHYGSMNAAEAVSIS